MQEYCLIFSDSNGTLLGMFLGSLMFEQTLNHETEVAFEKRIYA